MLSDKKQSRINQAKEALRESGRKQIVNITVVLFLWLMLVGLAKPFLTPLLVPFGFEASDIKFWLSFAMDPAVIWAYFLAFKYKLWPRPSPLFVYGATLYLGSIPYIIVQCIFRDLDPFVGYLGWRITFGYLPLAFLLGEQLQARDLARLCKLILYASIPMAALVYIQYHSPAASPVNMSRAVKLVNGALITTGSFEHTHFLSYFIASTFALCLANWILPSRQRLLGLKPAVITSAAVVVLFAHHLNRTPYFFAVSSTLAAILSIGLLLKSGRMRNALIAMVSAQLL